MLSPITEATTWTFHMAAMLAFVRAAQKPEKATRWILGGSMTGVAVLFKESALSLILPILLFQVVHLWGCDARRRWATRCALYWLAAAVLPFLYYAFVIDGGFGEIARNLREHIDSRGILSDYLRSDARGAATAFGAVYGWGLAPALLGLVLVWAKWRKFRSVAPLFSLWILGGCSVFLLPYLYPRFLVYTIAPTAWFAATAIWLGIRWLRKKSLG
jgi:hypothetical protein